MRLLNTLRFRQRDHHVLERLGDLQGGWVPGPGEPRARICPVLGQTQGVTSVCYLEVGLWNDGRVGRLGNGHLLLERLCVPLL